jgi:hypothetical protein
MHKHWLTAKTARLLPKPRRHDLVFMHRLLAMRFRVTCGAERDQVLVGIVSGLASMLLMVDLKVHPCATCLASPAVPPQDLSTELLVRFRIQPQALTFLSDRAHKARPFACSRNAYFCSPGRNLKNCWIDCSNISEFPSSRCAPARKSAQIISRQYPRDFSVPSIRAAVSRACSRCAFGKRA